MERTKTYVTADINHMSMTDYMRFRRQVGIHVPFELTYEYCKRMYIETGREYWLNEMIERVSPWETGG